MIERDNILYLEMEDVVAIYAALFAFNDQEAAARLCDRDGLAGALNRPLACAYYQSADLPLQAAALAHGIAEGQPFLDGNKRTALESLRVFLLANGYALTATPRERYAWMLDLSRGGTMEALAEQIRQTMREADS